MFFLLSSITAHSVLLLLTFGGTLGAEPVRGEWRVGTTLLESLGVLGHHGEWGGKRRNSKVYSGEVSLRQRRLNMHSRRNGSGVKRLPALWLGVGTGQVGRQVLNEAAAFRQSVKLVKRSKEGDEDSGEAAPLRTEVGAQACGYTGVRHSQHSAHANLTPAFGLRVSHLLALLP